MVLTGAAEDWARDPSLAARRMGMAEPASFRAGGANARSTRGGSLAGGGAGGVPGRAERARIGKVEAYVQFDIEKTLIQAQKLRKHDALSGGTGAREVSTDVLRHVTLNLFKLDFESTREDLMGKKKDSKSNDLWEFALRGVVERGLTLALTSPHGITG